jgi:nucleoside 2-deoxyribosyltransferase
MRRTALCIATLGCTVCMPVDVQPGIGPQRGAVLIGQPEATMTKTSKVRVYMAGPYGFAPSTERFMRDQYYQAVVEAGCEVVDPWRRTVSARPDREELMAIGRDNAKDIDASDGVVAALDGPDVDSGTASEIGYAAARGKWIVGYRGDFRQTGESPKVVVNLQVEYFIRQSGGEIVRSLEDLTAAVLRRTRHGGGP